ncbi:ABC transporter substrate-binding protein [Trichocoleus desertorum]|uniref:ABC transporter substrate-binding protein n=1 Tax=Trichocoleus desertorum GB2-A4 TaxID=2933944 RepID=A0ABV0J6T4_9CYAN|nr:ABC transporter substrate-binding protein [Trichocoleus sp. FACHB-46]
MSKLVVFKFGEGSFAQGFPVTLQIGDDGQASAIEVRGRFPAAPDIPQLYQQWQHLYYRLGGMRIEVPPAQVTNVSTVTECDQAAQKLRASLIHWWSQASVRDLREQVQEEVQRHEAARVIVQTQDLLLRKLPWHLWALFERRPGAEMALCADYAPPSPPLHSPVRILAVLGNSEGIDVQADRAVLEQLPGAKVTLLEKPCRQQLTEQLWSQPWDILFFAGHSSSEERGQIQINDTETLSLDQLRYGLKAAVRNNLKLAIFNSCDGLELARHLADLGIPQVIVMREPVPDPVAQAFLRYFLQAFAQGQSLYLSVRQAREQLQGMEGDFPCASWLPVLCQNPVESPLAWPVVRKPYGLAKTLFGGAIAALCTGMLQPTPPLPTPWANRISLGDKILVRASATPTKEAGVKAFRTKQFSSAAQQFQASLQQQHNDPETLIYLNNARIANQAAVRVAVSVPIGSNLNVAQEILRGVAQAQDEINRQGGLRGQLLQVAIADDENQPAIARQIATALVKDTQTIAVVGHNASDASVAAAPIYDEGELVMLSPTSFSDKLSSSGKYIFRMVPSIRFIADALARYTIKNDYKVKIAICSDTAAVDNESFRNQFTAAVFADGGQFINVPCDFSASDFNAETAIATIISSGADSILLAPHVDRINKAVEMARANQGRLTLFGSPTLYTSQTLQAGQNTVNGLVLPVPWHPTPRAKHSFLREAQQLWGGSVNWRTAMSYDATKTVYMGLQHQQTRKGLRDTLRSPDFLLEGASGVIQFLPSGERRIVPSIGVLVKVQPSTKAPLRYEFALLKP